MMTRLVFSSVNCDLVSNLAILFFLIINLQTRIKCSICGETRICFMSTDIDEKQVAIQMTEEKF